MRDDEITKGNDLLCLGWIDDKWFEVRGKPFQVDGVAAPLVQAAEPI